MTVAEFRRAGGKPLRSHEIRFYETSEKKGFGHGEIYEGECAWQFSLTSNEHGRVHGLLVQNIFYVIWLDPKHRLYAEK